MSTKGGISPYISHEDIQSAVLRLAKEINIDYYAKELVFDCSS